MKYEPDTDRIGALVEQAERPAIKSLWLRRLGQVYRASGDYVAAKAAFRSAIEWHPDNLDARNELAVCYLETGDTVRGMAALEASLDRDDDYAYTNRLIGIALYHGNSFAKAISYLEKSVDADPENPETWNYLAASYFLTHDSAHYLRTLNRIERLHDSLRTAAFMAGELEKHGFLRQADELRQVILQSEPF
jgi:tetratricopeptide (TPR) repeat protein